MKSGSKVLKIFHIKFWHPQSQTRQGEGIQKLVSRLIREECSQYLQMNIQNRNIYEVNAKIPLKAKKKQIIFIKKPI